MADEEGNSTPAPKDEEGASTPAPNEDTTPTDGAETSESPVKMEEEGDAAVGGEDQDETAGEAVPEAEEKTETEEVKDEAPVDDDDKPPEDSAAVEGGEGAESPAKEETAVEEGESTDDVKPDEEQADQDAAVDEQKPEDVLQADDEAEADKETPLPHSEDFSKGDITEDELIKVTEDVLSREGTPPPVTDGLEDTEMVQPGTPDKEEYLEELEEMEEEEVIPKYNRDELIERYHTALQVREGLNQRNHALQHKLAEYFKRKKTEDSRQEVDRNVTDQEQRYSKYMSNLDDLRQQENGERESYNEQIEEMKERKAVKQGVVENEWDQYAAFRRSIALASVNSRSGRPLTLKEYEVYEINEVKKEQEVAQVRLENIKLRNRLRKRELQLKQKEELAEGLHLIDFEQLKIENQTYNEKIEERNEELMKLRKKITSTVQVLTHLKEKLQFVQGENHVSKQELTFIEAEVANKRDILSRTKQSRDALRHDNGKLQQKCGLLGNQLLLRDYEEGTDESNELSFQLEQLKRTHAELTLSINGVKKKIEQARAQAQS